EIVARIEACLTRRIHPGSSSQRLVRRAVSYIHEHYPEPITRDDIARYVAISADYLTDCFHKDLGVTPMSYLTRYRIMQAKMLLDTTEYRITEIAAMVGFAEVSHFTRTFQREVGVSPRAYRRGQHRQRN
ncbi:MAG TPA: AraC family transcriptional regulator, partial [Roseiflexaceae bacterium]|nr:AraC family transcriptional regulator [Roseiflexaceae bacterium]